MGGMNIPEQSTVIHSLATALLVLTFSCTTDLVPVLLTLFLYYWPTVYKTLPRLGVQFHSASRRCGFCVSSPPFLCRRGWRQGLENLDEGLFSKSCCRRTHKNQTSESKA